MLSLLIEPAPLLARGVKQTSEIIIMLGVIVAVGVALAWVAMTIRRRMNAEPDDPPLGFTLADLRKLHAMGQLSDEELKRAEAKSLARSRALYLGSDADAGEASEADPDTDSDARDEGEQADDDGGLILDPPEPGEGEDQDGQSEQR